MIKASVIVLLVIALFSTAQRQGSSQNSPIMGGFTAFNDFNDPSFKKVLNAVYRADPRVDGWAPYNATSQLVAGIIYHFYLKSPQDSSSAYVSGFDDFISGTVRIMKYISPETPSIPTTSVTSKLLLNQNANPSTPVFKPFTDNSNISFQKALAQAKNQDYFLFQNYQLSGTELWVSSRFYYFKFTLASRKYQTGFSLQLFEVVAFENPIVEPSNGAGKILNLNLNKPELFQSAYQQIVKVYPRFARYDIASVKKQIVTGANYYFVMERRYEIYQRVSITVFVDLQSRYQISASQDDLSFGYSQQVIEQTKLIASKTWPELQDYVYYQTNNIRNDKMGLRISYRSMFNKGGVKYVDLNIVNGKESLTLNSL